MATTKLHNLFDLQMHNDWETTFATEEGSFSARRVRAISLPQFQAAQEVFEDESIRGQISPIEKTILGTKSGTLNFNTFVRGFGTAAGDGVESLYSATRADGYLFYSALGGETTGTGTTVDDLSATATEFDVADASGLTIGGAVMVDGEIAPIANIDSNTITLGRALSSAPSNGATVYAATTYYGDETNIPGYLQFRGLTAEGNAEGFYQMMGCVCGLKLNNLSPGQVPEAQWEVMASNWAHNSGVSLSPFSHTNSNQPSIPGSASTLYLQDSGTTTRKVVGTNAISIDPGITWEGVRSISGTQGFEGWIRTAFAPTMELTLTNYESDYVDDFTNQQAFYMNYQIGSTAGNAIMFEIPVCYINELPVRASANSQAGMTVKLVGRANASGSTTLTRSAFKIHIA